MNHKYDVPRLLKIVVIFITVLPGISFGVATVTPLSFTNCSLIDYFPSLVTMHLCIQALQECVLQQAVLWWSSECSQILFGYVRSAKCSLSNGITFHIFLPCHLMYLNRLQHITGCRASNFQCKLNLFFFFF